MNAGKAWFMAAYPLERFTAELGLAALPDDVVQVRYQMLLATWQERVLLDVVSSLPDSEQEELGGILGDASPDTLQELIVTKYPDMARSLEGYAQQVLDGYLAVLRIAEG